MERKNMVLLTVIAVATLLVAVVGATFAYFTATAPTDNRTDENGGKGATNISAANLKTEVKKTMNAVSGIAGSFTKTDVFPGHKEVAALELAVSTTNETGATIQVPFIYTITENNFANHIKLRLYKSTVGAAAIDSADMGCTVHADTTSEDGKVHYSETCTVENGSEASKFGELIVEKEIPSSPQTIELVVDTITVSDNQEVKYNYYAVLEYFNEKSTEQDAEQGQSLKGTLKVA